MRVWVVSTAATSARDWEVLKSRLRRRRPPVASAGVPLDDHPRVEERVEPLGDGHPRQARDLEDVAAGQGATLADQVEDVAGSGRHRRLLGPRICAMSSDITCLTISPLDKDV